MGNSRFAIDGREIGLDHPPYVIAELSGNHNGSLENALKLIEKAKEAGADAVKLQTYTADTLTIDSDKPDFLIQDGLWKGRTLYELYEWAHTPWEWHQALFEHAREIGITIFSSPFDLTAIDLLEELETPAYKIASFELVDHELIRGAARTGKPMIMSTGMATLEEIRESVSVARAAGCERLALLHCVSGYPAPPEDYNLRTLPHVRAEFGLQVGLSDHTLSSITAIAAVAVGATLLEKHFTLDRSGGGPDDSFSLEPRELQALCAATADAWRALGDVNYTRKSSEVSNVRFRRSLYFTADLQPGSVVGREDVRAIRPGYGLPPRLLAEVVGRTVKRAVGRGDPVKWSDLSDEKS